VNDVYHIGMWCFVQRSVGVGGLLTVLGSLPHRDGINLRRGSALWRHLASWLRDVTADSLIEQSGTSFSEILCDVMSSWLHGATDCCRGETAQYCSLLDDVVLQFDLALI